MPRAQGKHRAVSSVAIQRNNDENTFDTGPVTAQAPTGRSDQRLGTTLHQP
jgi:hypothetical protein